LKRQEEKEKGKERHLVVESNVLLESRYNITLLELKMFLAVLTQIRRDDNDYRTYTVAYSDFLDKIETNHPKIYEYLKKACIALMNKVLVIPRENGDLFSHFCSSIEIFRHLDIIEFSFDRKLLPYLLQLKSHFTIFDIRNVMRCHSVYSVRLYQLLKQYEKVGSRTIELDELKAMLGVADKYRQWINFRSTVIEPAEKELKKYSDIFFTYTTKRKGRKIHYIRFKIQRKRQSRLSTEKTDDVITIQELDETIPVPYSEFVQGA